MKAFILGSSHIVRFKNYVQTHDIKLQHHEIQMQGVNGGMVSSLFKYLIDICRFSPDVVFIQIGSNDIGSSENSVVNIEFAIQHFIEVLFSMNIPLVMVGLLFNRNKVLAKRGLTVSQYNDRVIDLNCKLQHLQHFFNNRMLFWVHRGLQFPTHDILDKHGVHLNTEGNRRLRLSIRGALIYAEKNRVI
ncbi:unnamed protein product [Mytilus coruscus]|uniref:SGNH hydrolase-type esterase domain-containing protein n=1 Tax=Mytilus coruscus TaxID=42192 RepID=A0A6J8C3Y8_MYTCO|nr:unnamed protein product [Mytilus coruscus]